MYGAGISREGTLLDLGVTCEVVQKSGAFFSYKDERIGQGRANAKIFLAENPDMADAIEAEIRERAGIPAVTAFEPAEPEAKGKTKPEGKAAAVPASPAT
jgi:recombination protein RecA